MAIGLDTAVYIGIGVDVVLALVAGVLIYLWRKRRSDASNERKKVSRYMISQRESVRTELAGMSVTSEDDDEGIPNEEQKQVNAVLPVQRDRSWSAKTDGNSNDAERVEGNFAFLNSHMQTQSENPTSDEAAEVKDSRRSRVTFSDLNDEDGPEGDHYPANSEERVIHNPLSTSITQHTTVTGLDETPDSPQNEDIAVSTYYTYSPPSNDLDGESSEVLSDGERSPPPPTPSPPPPPPPPMIVLNQVEPGTGSDIESQVTPPPPSPPDYDSDESSENIPNPLYQTAGSVSDGRSDADSEGSGYDAKSCSTMNFGEEDVAKLYNTELDESTEIM